MSQESESLPDMYEDMCNADWFVAKVRDNKVYAQNLYAAMCNMQWQKLEIMSVLRNDLWGCSWRSAGGKVADLRGEGDYMDWYCSGRLQNPDNHGHTPDGYVSEGTVTNEIEEDLSKLGWTPVPYKDDGC